MAYTRRSFGGRHRMINDETNIFSWFFRTSPKKGDDNFFLCFRGGDDLQRMTFKGNLVEFRHRQKSTQIPISTAVSLYFLGVTLCVCVFFVLFVFFFVWMNNFCYSGHIGFFFCFFFVVYILSMMPWKFTGFFCFHFMFFVFLFFVVVRKNCNRW